MAMSKPVLYGPAFSTYVRTARLALEEKGVAYELRDLDMSAGAHTEPDYAKLNPFNRVPTLDHGGFVVYETRAITAYGDEAFEGAGVGPGGEHGGCAGVAPDLEGVAADAGGDGDDQPRARELGDAAGEQLVAHGECALAGGDEQGVEL